MGPASFTGDEIKGGTDGEKYRRDLFGKPSGFPILLWRTQSYQITCAVIRQGALSARRFLAPSGYEKARALGAYDLHLRNGRRSSVSSSASTCGVEPQIVSQAEILAGYDGQLCFGYLDHLQSTAP